MTTMDRWQKVQNNQIDHPDHYNQGKIECIDAIEAALTPDEFRGFCKGNTMKYIWRERGKGNAESLEKAKWCLAKLITLEHGLDR